MRTTPKEYSVRELVDAWKSALLRRNEEYQRGAAWSVPQKQALIDSIFRAYPIPALFLQKIVSAPGLGGETSTRYDVVDGQQRLIALHEFLADNYSLLSPEDRRLKLPGSLRSAKAPWAKKKFQELDIDLRNRIESTKLNAYLIEDVANQDEVRDLFIRLQSGTALSRQQIRDAWPGNIGPYIQRLAGKLGHRPSCSLFKLIDKRGTRTEDEEQRDVYVTDRQLCAQLLRVFLERERDPRSQPSVTANDLDALYHGNTDFDPIGRQAKYFEECLDHTTQILARYLEGQYGKRKVRKLDAFALFQFLQDALRNEKFRLDQSGMIMLAASMAAFSVDSNQAGKSTSGQAIHDYYEKWREVVTKGIGIELDARRSFDDAQKAVLFKRADGQCALCGDGVAPEDAEYDHYPIPWHAGGRSEVENGRLVHRNCHPRGRPARGKD